MIIAVTEMIHDYEARIRFVDTDKLDQDDYVDMKFLKAVQKGDSHCFIDAEKWEDHPDKFPSDDIGISDKAYIKKPENFQHAIILRIDFNA